RNNSLRVCLRLPAYSASAKVICFIGKLGGWSLGILPKSGSLFQSFLSMFMSEIVRSFNWLLLSVDADMVVGREYEAMANICISFLRRSTIVCTVLHEFALADFRLQLSGMKVTYKCCGGA
ncbi:MAG: hypothetical protein VCA57_10335, partial [Pseudomonas sp.]|uniref:hypothetical protein n=1 Tax=Pseudomonas sp. TaxID=306 RepID=UPI0039826E7C